MFAAGVLLEVGLVAAGVVVVIAAMHIAGRSRDPAQTQAPSPAEPVAPPQAQRIAAPERRGLSRAPVARPVVVRRGGAEQRTFALDVSAGGLLVAGPADLAVGELIDIRLDLGEPVNVRAEVVRDGPNGIKGLRFEAIAEPDRERLERFVRSGAVTI